MILDITVRFIIINKFGIFQKVGQNDRKLSKMKNQKVGWRQISLERVTEHLQSSSIAHSKERKNHIGAPAPLVDFSSAFKPLNNKENGQSLFWSITHFGLSHENGILTISTRNMPQMILKRS